MDRIRIAQLKDAEAFTAYLSGLGLALGFDAKIQHGEGAPLAAPYPLSPDSAIGNRFCVQPMEGWDGTTDGRASELTYRRWRRFGSSGAKLIWGGEAVAVNPEARDNPTQLIASEATLSDLTGLRKALVDSHAQRWRTDDLLIGLQLTHSGRFCRPDEGKGLRPHILYNHPLLNRKFNLPDDYPVLSDGEIEAIIQDYIIASGLAYRAGFDFVDLKHCHGYLGHEFLSAFERPGKYGGSFENRTRFLREMVAGLRSEVPEIGIGVRLSAYDFIPFHPNEEGIGEPAAWEGHYPFTFGGDGSGTGIDLTETHAFLDLLASLGIRLVNITAGNPYACPHILRPAWFPPSDGYQPPEDPLVGVARMIDVTAQLKAAHPELVIVGSGYSYLQEWLPNVAQYVIRSGQADFAGLGRMMLSYPEMCADVLEGKPLQRRCICRTFSDCTTAPRGGMVSGCYPLDEFYKSRPEAVRLKQKKTK